MKAPEEAIALAFKAEVSTAIRRAMKKQKLSQSELARRMQTSRAVVHRLLKTDDSALTLATLCRAANALGRTARVRLAT